MADGSSDTLIYKMLTCGTIICLNSMIVYKAWCHKPKVVEAVVKLSFASTYHRYYHRQCFDVLMLIIIKHEQRSECLGLVLHLKLLATPHSTVIS